MRLDRHQPSLFRQREAARRRLLAHWAVSWMPGHQPLPPKVGSAACAVLLCFSIGFGCLLHVFFAPARYLLLSIPLAALSGLAIVSSVFAWSIRVVFHEERALWLNSWPGMVWKAEFDALSLEFGRFAEARALRWAVFRAQSLSWTIGFARRLGLASAESCGDATADPAPSSAVRSAPAHKQSRRL